MRPVEGSLNSSNSFIEQKFEFKEWEALYKNDPFLFEKRRREMNDQFVKLAPKEYRFHLRKLISQIDKVRAHSTDPTETCVNILFMMQNSLSDLRYFLNDLTYTLRSEISENNEIQKSDK